MQLRLFALPTSALMQRGCKGKCSYLDCKFQLHRKVDHVAADVPGQTMCWVDCRGHSICCLVDLDILQETRVPFRSKHKDPLESVCTLSEHFSHHHDQPPQLVRGSLGYAPHADICKERGYCGVSVAGKAVPYPGEMTKVTRQGTSQSTFV